MTEMTRDDLLEVVRRVYSELDPVPRTSCPACRRPLPSPTPTWTSS